MRLLVLWIWFCAYVNCAGWFLSAVHELNASGYIVVLALWLATLFFGKKLFFADRVYFGRQRLYHRFRKPFPLVFLVLATLSLLGGILYAPTNYDALSYRLPRVLHWLSAGHWHWIHTVYDRVNDRSCGIEWVSAPFLAIFKSDRFLFLINFISFLFLPGLVFDVFRRLGVRRRVAWHWMWLAPSGYGFVLQAGSIGNDLFGATFALAAVAFAMRASQSRSATALFVSMLSVALMTSAKTSSLPLLLPWAVAAFPSVKWAVRKPFALAVVSAMAVFASALPTMVFNQKYFGDWSGAGLNVKAEHAVILKSAANTVLLTLENFVPPVFPADRWNQAMDTHLSPALINRLSQIIEPPGCKFYLQQMQVEENGGLGFGISVLLCLSAAVVFAGRTPRPAAAEPAWRKAVRWAPVISLLVVLTQSNLTAIARVLVPYYLLLLPPVLAVAGHEQLLKARWWRLASYVVFAMAGALLVISPARPLYPALTIANCLSVRHPGSRAAARMEGVYLVYRQRHDAFAPVKQGLPPGVTMLGLTTYDEPETSLWLPLGSRRIVHVCPDDSPAYLKSEGIEYILAKEEMFGSLFPESFPEWLKAMNAETVKKFRLNLRATTGFTDWDLVKLD